MTARRPLRMNLILVAAAVALVGRTHAIRGADGVRSVRQILEVKKSWPLFAENEIPFVLQGHIGSVTNNEIHMRYCRELRFFLSSDTDPLRLPPGKTMVKLTGKFKMRDETPIFEVDKIETTSSFVQQHRARSVEIKFRDPDAWRKLAANTKAEAVFNQSPELHALAREAFVKACREERAEKKQVTDENLAAWITEMKKFGVEQQVLDVWEHERLWQKWRSVQSASDPDVALRFANELATKFPEARTPLELPQPKLHEAYRQNPQELFSEADEDRRKRLLRLFYMDVLRREILMKADPKGSNADAVAARLKASLPDDPDLINRYEDLHLSWRFSQLPQASRQAAIELSREYRERQLPKKARETLEVWLEARLASWRKEGARGLVRAAGEYTTLLEDETTAHELLLNAWKLAPGEDDTKAALERLGYRLHDGRWITEKEFEDLPPDRIEEAIKAGEVLLQMTANDVRRALGLPAEIKTSVSAERVTQAWIYGEPGTVRSVVHLLRSSGQPVEQARVIAIGELKPHTRRTAEPREEDSPETDEE